MAAATPPSLLQRLGWMALLWVASVAALGVVAMLIRALMHAAGMRS
jgi:hypothetical protein